MFFLNYKAQKFILQDEVQKENRENQRKKGEIETIC